MECSQFLRSEMLLGAQSTQVLRQKRVILFGLGGVGSYAAEILARAGIGEITVVDHDTVSETNLNRQLCALHSTLGRPKAAVVRERLLDINPACRVTAIEKMYLPACAKEFALETYDYILDAIDNVTAKLSLAVEAQAAGVSLIACMGTGNKFDPMQFRVSDINRTSGDPLCRVMRKELRARGVDRLQVVWSPELPVTPEGTPEQTGRRQTPGSLPFVPGAAGLLMAGTVVRALLQTAPEQTREEELK
ncbi:MAG: tRNA threonylcarbamoyladenosine dehydratase [Clostridia bacterium]|nr:tRNA threonylcarbamoyladenosine dehydratase [Clostridia bacterium]